MNAAVAAGDAPLATADDARATLDRLVEDVQQLRLEISGDLTVAAAAVEMNAAEFAADLVERDQRELQALSDRATDRLLALDALRLRHGPSPHGPVTTSAPGGPSGPRRPPRGRVGRRPGRRDAGRSVRTRFVAAPLAFAVGAIALMLSGTLTPGRAAQPVATSPVAASWQQFAQAATTHTDAHAVIAAAARLHHSLSSLIQAARNDPMRAQQALQMLELEHQLIVDTRPEGAAFMLGDVAALARELRSIVPSVVLPATLIHPVLPARPTRRHPTVIDVTTSQQPGANTHASQPASTSTTHTHPSAKPSPATHTTSPSTAPSSPPQPSSQPTPPSWQPLPTHSSLFG